MKVTSTDLPGVVVVEPKAFGDDRGFFLESYNKRAFAAAGLPENFVQDNHSRSQHNVLRGLHYQIKQPQGKLVHVVAGEIFDVAVDIRRSSKHFGKWTAVLLNAKDHRQLWVPPGFAHGFLVVSKSADVMYKTTDYYAPEHERSIIWNDPSIAIAWPIKSVPLLSSKDMDAPLLEQAEVYDS